MPQPTTDVEILNFALTLEHFENALYKTLITANLLTGVEAQYLQTFGAHEAAHVATLTQTITQLGGKPVAPLPAYNFPKITTRADLISTIVSVEDLGASAYLGQAPFLQNKDLLEAAVNIHNVEAEHAAVWRIVAGSPVAPDTVAKGTPYDDVLRIVMPFLQGPTGGTTTTTAPAATATPAAATAPATAVPPSVVAVSPVASSSPTPSPVNLPMGGTTTATPVSVSPVPTQPAAAGSTDVSQPPFTPHRLGNG